MGHGRSVNKPGGARDGDLPCRYPWTFGVAARPTPPIAGGGSGWRSAPRRPPPLKPRDEPLQAQRGGQQQRLVALAEHFALVADAAAYALVVDALLSEGPASVERSGARGECTDFPLNPSGLAAVGRLPGTLPKLVRQAVANGPPNLPLVRREPPLANGPSTDSSEVLPPFRLRATVEQPQASLRRITATLTCEGTDCEARAGGRLRVKREGKATKRFPLTPDQATLAVVTPVDLAPKTTRRARRAARRALRRGGKVQAKLKLRARSEVGDRVRTKARLVAVRP